MKKRLTVLLSLCGLLLLPAFGSASTPEATPLPQMVKASCADQATSPILTVSDPTIQGGWCPSNRNECNTICWEAGCWVSYFYCDPADPWNYICECWCPF